jgi:hypothetical protein
MNQRALNQKTELHGAKKDPKAMNQRALNRHKNEHKTLNRRESSHARHSESTTTRERLTLRTLNRRALKEIQGAVMNQRAHKALKEIQRGTAVIEPHGDET